MADDYDVIVVGAGFAGATVARECATRGLRTLVLEARDRVGGRTWTSALSDGELVELGGTYVHWSQPHTWSEISRYGLQGDVVPADEASDWILVPKCPGLEWCAAEEYGAREKLLFERVFEQSATVFPRPDDPLHAADAVAELDQLSIRARLDQLDLSPDDDALLSLLFGMDANDSVSEASFLSLMRWWAAAGHSYDAMGVALFGYQLAGGTGALIGAMLADGGAELHLYAPVSRIASDAAGVEVTCDGGRSFSAPVAVVATPSGVWPHLEFSPALSADRLEATGQGMQVARGSKAFAVIKGETRRFAALPHAGHPIAAMRTSSIRSDDEQLVVMSPGRAMRDAGDANEVRAAIEDLLPHVSVLEVLSTTYYEEDPFARGGWTMLKRGQLTRYAPHERFAQPEGRVVFATSDIARLWCGFIDGAIESGLRASRDVREILARDMPVPDAPGAT